MDGPFAGQPCPLLGPGGACDSSVLPVYLIPGYTTASQLGRHSGGANSLERFFLFLVPEQEHFFDLNFGTMF